MDVVKELWEGADPPPDLPAHLHDTWRAAQEFLALGRGEHIPPTQWPIERKKAKWATLIAEAGAKLEGAPEEHPWHDPGSDRLDVLADRLVESGQDRDFIEEMVGFLKDGAHGLMRERLLGRRWQHWSRFLGHTPRLPEQRWSPPGRLLSSEEFPFLISACLRDGSARAIRDAAMFALCYGVAASTDEIAKLRLSEYSPGLPSVRLGRGRGPFRDRILSPGYEAANLLSGWVALRGRKPGGLFYSLDNFGGVRSGRITGAAVHAALGQRSKQADLSPIAPEDLRRTGLTRLFEHGADLYALADIAGHQGLEDTERYEPGPSVSRTSVTLHGETPFHKW